MKNLLLIVVALFLLLPCVKAQSLALETPGAGRQFIAYSPAAFGQYHDDRQVAAITKVGTIMSGAGIIMGATGAAIAINSLVVSDDEFDSKLITGVALFVAGGVLGITGGCLAIAGIARQHHYHPGYGLNIVAPKNNELGVAYNF